MAITADCGPHCGIRSNAEGTVRTEGHCNCTELCHAGMAPFGGKAIRLIPGLGDASSAVISSHPGLPMCDRGIKVYWPQP